MAEAKWRNEGYIPTTEEYASVASISSGLIYLVTTSYDGMGDVLTEASFKWASIHPLLVKASCAIGRYLNDIVSHKKDEERNHVASVVQCYKEQFDVTKDHAYDLVKKKN